MQSANKNKNNSFIKYALILWDLYVLMQILS